MSIFTLERKMVPLQALRRDPSFVKLIGVLEEQLAIERQEYETQEANEFTRGRVTVLKELIKELKGA